MMTMGGARAAGLDVDIGSLEIGKKADMMLLRKDVPLVSPITIATPVIRTAYEHQFPDVDMVIINGKMNLQNGKLFYLDEKESLPCANNILTNLNDRITEPLRAETMG